MRQVLAIMMGSLLVLNVSAQEVVALDDFLKQVVQTHPVMQQSELRSQLGAANLRLERAVMDPTLSMGYADKAYDDKDYYDKRFLRLSLPTSIGVEIFTGYAENTGARINPELRTGSVGQYEAGVSLPLGSSLIFNERNQSIKQAKLMAEAANQERRIIQNDLLYRAGLAYLNWSLAYALLAVQESALQISIEQFEFARNSFLSGDRPAIDTVESFLQVQNRTFQLLEAQKDLNAAKLIVSSFLWDAEGNPAQLRQESLPSELSMVSGWFETVPDSIIGWRNELSSTHPELAVNSLRIQSLELDRQTQISRSLPQLEMKYAVLSPGISNPDLNAIGLNDRMLGVGLSYPLLSREGRAKTRTVNIKALESQLDLDLKQVNLSIQLDQEVFNYQVNQEQTQLYNDMVGNFERLLEAEKTKFELGESSVFLLNSRENKLFEAQTKRLETEAQLNSSALKIIRTANRTSYYMSRLR